MEEKQPLDKRFALLIDADNVSAKYIKPIMDELSKYGTVTIKRIYGDWTLTLHAKWKDALLENSLTPIQQFGYTQGKNATDSAMIIDAMDILYTDKVDGFCIVSSDSDFTRLASRLRESGLTVIGMGEKKTPVPFRKACDIFTTLELLLGGRRDRDGNRGQGQEATPKDAIEQAVVDIITDNQNNGKSTGLGEVGSRLLKRYPDFDVRSYGTNLLSKLLSEFERVQITKSGSNVSVELVEDKAAGDEGKAAPAEEDATSEKSPTTDEAPTAQASKPRRSRRRRSKGSSEAKAMADAAPGESEPASAESSGKELEAGGERESELELADKLLPSAEAEGKTEPAPKRTPEPNRKRRTRKYAAEPTRSSGTADSAQTPEAAKAKNTEAKSRAKKTAATEETPESYIRQQMHEAGAAGVNLNSLAKRVRTKFRTFKLRELGYTQFRHYVVSLGDVTVEKQGGEYVAKLGE